MLYEYFIKYFGKEIKFPFQISNDSFYWDLLKKLKNNKQGQRKQDKIQAVKCS